MGAEQTPGSPARCGNCGALFRVPGPGVDRILEEREREEEERLPPRRRNKRMSILLSKLFPDRN